MLDSSRSDLLSETIVMSGATNPPQNVDTAFYQLVETKAENLDMTIYDVEAMKDNVRRAAEEGDEITAEDEIVMDGVLHHNEQMIRRDTIGLQQQAMLNNLKNK